MNVPATYRTVTVSLKPTTPVVEAMVSRVTELKGTQRSP